MTSKAEAKRRRRAKREFPSLAPIEKQQQHRVAGKFARDDDPRKTARTARERQLGGKRADAALDPILGHEIGYVIQSECKPDLAKRLWDTWQAYSAAERTYRVRYIGQTGEPKGASMQMVTERMETDKSMHVDLRTEEERDTQAVSGYMRWQGYLGHLDAQQASALRQAERGNGKALWVDGKATQAGIFALNALIGLRNASEKS